MKKTIKNKLLEYGITPREMEVSEHVIKGLSNPEIGVLLFVTTKAVKFHLTNIYRKTEVTNRRQFMVKFLQNVPFDVKHEIVVFKTDTMLPMGVAK